MSTTAGAVTAVRRVIVSIAAGAVTAARRVIVSIAASTPQALRKRGFFADAAARLVQVSTAAGNAMD